MSLKEKLEKLEKTIDKIEESYKNTKTILSEKFPINSHVLTKKGCRFKGPFEAIVVGYGHWKNYPAVNVKKDNGKIVRCLAKNLIRIDNIGGS